MRHKFICLTAIAILLGFAVGCGVTNACTDYPNPANCAMTTTTANDVSPPQTNFTVCDASGKNAVMTADSLQTMENLTTNESPPAVCGQVYNYATIDVTMTVAGSTTMTSATATNSVTTPTDAMWVAEFPNPYYDDAEINYAYVNTGSYGAPRKFISSTSCVYVEAGIMWDAAMENVQLTWLAARDCVMATASGIYFGTGTITSEVRCCPATLAINANNDAKTAMKSVLNC